MSTICTLSDNDLILGYRNGDNACFDMLLERYQDKVYGYIFSVVHDKELADDLFQETFCKAIYTIKNGLYKDENKFIHWVMRIAHNLIVDHYRYLSKMPTAHGYEGQDLMGNLSYKDRNVEQNLMRQQSHRNVRQLIKLLPPEQKRVVVLRHYGRLDFREIASRTGVSINTALGRMRYAILNLRRLADKNDMYIDL